MDQLPHDGVTQRMTERDAWCELAGHPRERAAWTRLRSIPAVPSTEERARLARTIETEIIPRLVLAHEQPAAGRLDGSAAAAPGVGEFLRIVVAGDFASAAAYVEARRARGASVEALCLDLLAPVARRLGEMWEQDLCSFADVTVALWRLQQVLRELGEAPRARGRQCRQGLRILLLPAIGEQHTFGLAMVMEFFRRAGWEVWGGPPASIGELRALGREEWFDVVGFSASSDRGFDSVAPSIRALRRASRNPVVGVMVGGPAFRERPERVAQVGADAMAKDGAQAPLQAERLLGLLGQARR